MYVCLLFCIEMTKIFVTMRRYVFRKFLLQGNDVIKHDIRLINFRLWLVLVLTSFMPLIYSTTRIYFLGSIPNTWTFSIAAQVAWLNVCYEVLSEALLVPLSYILGKALSDGVGFNYRGRKALKIILSTYLVVTFFVILFTEDLVVVMHQQEELFDTTVNYIRLESIAIFISSFYAFFSLVLVLKNEKKIMYKLLITQVLLMIFLDSLLVSQLSFSLNLGVNGVAISNIVVNLFLAFISIIYFVKYGLLSRASEVQTQQVIWLKEWAKIGWKSGLESFVRNTAFIVMILQLVNEVQQAGTYWVANQFIWGWLLLPVLALGKLVTQDAATSNGLSQVRVQSYLWLTVGIILVWGVTSPMWSGFISNIMGIVDSTAIIELVYLLVVFYIIFSLNNVIDSYFYGIGRTDLMLYQSLIVNGLFYGGAFVCYQVGMFTPNLETISLMFGVGITVDAVITWLLYRIHRNRQIGLSSFVVV